MALPSSAGTQRPFSEIVAIGRLHEASARQFLEEDLRPASPVRYEKEPLTCPVVCRHEEERMVILTWIGRHLPDRMPRFLITTRSRFTGPLSATFRTASRRHDAPLGLLSALRSRRKRSRQVFYTYDTCRGARSPGRRRLPNSLTYRGLLSSAVGAAIFVTPLRARLVAFADSPKPSSCG